jgi:serine/threonine-protein kinase
MESSKKPKGKALRGLFANIFPHKSGKRRLFNFIIVPLISLFILYLFIDVMVMSLITRHGSEFRLPDIMGYDLEAATELLNHVHLGIEVTSQEYHADKSPGMILSQYPPAGTKVKSGRIVKVVTSMGAKDVVVPLLAGFSVRQAKLNIEAADLTLGDIAWTYSDSLPEKVVVFAYPASGSKVPIGSPINLMVNRGRLAGIVYMPRLVGKQLEDAVAILEKLGLKVGLVTHIRNENYLPETVLEQSVEEATELEPGEEIDLMVSTTE